MTAYCEAWSLASAFSMSFCLSILLGQLMQDTMQDVTTVEKSFDLSTGRLAGGKYAEELWPLNRRIERRIPAGICHSRCRIGCMRCALTGNLNSVFSWWECGLELYVFPTSIFLIIDVFPPHIEKERIEQLLHQSLEPTLSVCTSPRSRSRDLAPIPTSAG